MSGVSTTTRNQGAQRICKAPKGHSAIWGPRMAHSWWREGASASAALAVVVHLKFLRGRAQANGVNLVFVLVVDVGLDEILGENIAFG